MSNPPSVEHVSKPVAQVAFPAWSAAWLKRWWVWLAFQSLLTLLCGVMLVFNRDTEFLEAEQRALSAAKLTQQAAAAALDKIDVALLSLSGQLSRQMQGAGLDRALVWSMVDEQADRLPEVLTFGMFDAQGQQICGRPADRCLHLDVSDRDYFRELQDHPLSARDSARLHGPYPNRVNGQPALVLARSVKGADGRFGGVVVAVLPLEALQPVIDGVELGEGGAISLRSLTLKALVRRPALARADSGSASGLVSQTLREAIQTAPDQGVLRSVAPVDGVHRVSAYARLQRYPLYVLAGLSVDALLAVWWRQVALVAGILLTVWLSSAWMMSRLRPAPR